MCDRHVSTDYSIARAMVEAAMELDPNLAKLFGPASVT